LIVGVYLAIDSYILTKPLDKRVKVCYHITSKDRNDEKVGTRTMRKGTKKKRVCLWCRKEFETFLSTNIALNFCGLECAVVAYCTLIEKFYCVLMEKVEEEACRKQLKEGQ